MLASIEYLVSLVILGVYVKTLSPSIAGGDSGELVAEGCILGVAHPPGYPLFTMMVHAISKLVPLGGFGDDVAYLVNMSSAALSAGAAFFIGKIIRILMGEARDRAQQLAGDAGVVVGMGLFAFSPLIWQYAVTAEVFPLNTFFAAYILYLVLEYAKGGRDSTAVWGAMVCGVAFTNQHTIVLYEIPLISYMLLVMHRRLVASPMLTVMIGLAFLAGFSLYVYMPYSQLTKPEDGSWGHVTTLSGLLHHFLRRDYGTLQLFSGEAGRQTEGMWVRHAAYLTDVTAAQGLFVVPFLAFVAVLTHRRIDLLEDIYEKDEDKTKEKEKERREGQGTKLLDHDWRRKAPLALVASQLFYFFVFHSLANLPLSNRLHFGIHQRFWMQPNVLTFAWSGVGFAACVHYLTSDGTGDGLQLLKGLTPFKKGKSGMRAAAAAMVKGNKGKGGGLSPNPNPNPSTPGADATACSQVWRWLGLVVGVAMVFAQHKRWVFMSDQSNNYFFRNYATALLSPLPTEAVYLINYDQQWTSVRYVQKCRGVRSDVTAINLSMMTYAWFQYKHFLYPKLTMPAGSLGSRDVGNVTFTMSSFMKANDRSSSIYISGRLSHSDPEFERLYDTMPVGLTSAIVDRGTRVTSRAYRNRAFEAWQTVLSTLQSLPPEDQYPEETWEWTICRDFKDRVAETAAYLLEVAIADQEEDPMVLLDAMYWMEASVALERLGGGKVPWNVAKNAGLAHFNLAKNRGLDVALARAAGLEGDKGALLPPPPDIFGLASTIQWPGDDKTRRHWREWSASRFISHWTLFVDDPEAQRSSPEYDTIRKMLVQLKGGAKGAEEL